MALLVGSRNAAGTSDSRDISRTGGMDDPAHLGGHGGGEPGGQQDQKKGKAVTDHGYKETAGVCTGLLRV